MTEQELEQEYKRKMAERVQHFANTPALNQTPVATEQVVNEVPVMLQGVPNADYGQVPQETPYVENMLNEAVPQTAQQQQIPVAPPVQPQTQVIQAKQPINVEGYQPYQISEAEKMMSPADQLNELAQARQLEMAGAVDKINAEANMLDNAAKIQKNYANEVSMVQDQYLNDLQKRKESRKQELDGLKRLINSSEKIDPSRWWNSRTTGQKIAAGISALLSGFGRGTGFSVIENAMKADIAAQMANHKQGQEKANNLFSLYKQQGLEDDDAAQAAYTAGLKKTALMMDAKIAGIKSPAIRAKAKAEVGKIKKEHSRYLLNLLQKNAATKAKAASEIKPAKIGGEAIKKIGQGSRIVRLIRGMKSALAQGDWSKSAIKNQFNSLKDEAKLLVGFYISGANTAKEEAKSIDNIFSGKYSDLNNKLLKESLDRWESATAHDIGMYLDGAGLYPEQKQYFIEKYLPDVYPKDSANRGQGLSTLKRVK